MSKITFKRYRHPVKLRLSRYIDLSKLRIKIVVLFQLHFFSLSYHYEGNESCDESGGHFQIQSLTIPNVYIIGDDNKLDNFKMSETVLSPVVAPF